MNVLSLFDGMSCGQIALKELGVKINKYYASEVDKFAINQTQLNFPDTIQLGDVTKWKEWDIDWSSIDLVIGGSPCQGFSMAGKQLAFDDPRSVLFFEFVNIVNHVKKHNPNMKFLLENVQMAKRHLKVINDYMGVHPVEINSSIVSAQNRVRLYWSNIRVKESGLFGEKYTDIPQPKDRGIYLKDVLEYSVDSRFYLSNKSIKSLLKHKEKHDRKGNGFGADIRYIHQKGQTVRLGGKGMYDLVCVAQRGRGVNNKQQLEQRYDGKTNTLTTAQKDNYIVEYKNINGVNQIGNIVESKGYSNPQRGRIYGVNGKSPTLNTCAGGGLEPKIPTKTGRIRRLTPTECARLQTIPNWYKWECSDTQQYRMLGNGWTVEVIKHIFKYLYE